jgi:hypothetical protein
MVGAAAAAVGIFLMTGADAPGALGSAARQDAEGGWVKAWVCCMLAFSPWLVKQQVLQQCKNAKNVSVGSRVRNDAL